MKDLEKLNTHSGGAGLGAFAGMKKFKDPKKATMAAVLGSLGGSFAGDALGGAGGAALAATDGHKAHAAKGFGFGSLAGGAAGFAIPAGLALLLKKKNPALLSKLGKTPGKRLANAIGAGSFGSIVGGHVGLHKSLDED